VRTVAARGVNDGSRRPLDELFAALSDSTRRALLQSLVHGGPRTATQFAGEATISRQAIVKHLKALEDAGLVAAERTGREVKYRATTERLAEAVSWLLDAGESWDRRTARLRQAGAR
jgi:DNA-binding transcriptional ArsR family regulator